MDVHAIDDQALAGIGMDGPTTRSDERDSSDAHVAAAQQQDQFGVEGIWKSMREGTQQRAAEPFPEQNVLADEGVVELHHMVVVGGLTVDGAAALDGDVVEILTEYERGAGTALELFVVERGVEHRAGVEEQTDVALEADGPAGVVAGREQYSASARGGAGVDGRLDGGGGEIGLATGGAVVGNDA